MAERHGRRAFLSLLGAGAVAGCSELPTPSDRFAPVSGDPDVDWLQVGHDPGHTAHVPTAGGAPSEVRWEFGPHEHISAPVLVGNSVFVTAEVSKEGLFGHPKRTTKNVLFRIDADDGTAERVAATDDVDRWRAEDLAFHRGRFYLASSAELFALDARTGHVAWRQSGVSSLPTPTASDGRVVVACRDAACCFDAESGDRLWRNPIPVRRTILDPPAVADGRVVYVENDGDSTERPQSATVRAVEIDTGKEVWSKETTIVSFGTPVLADGTAYLGNGRYVYALDAETGARQWRTPIIRSERALGPDLCVGPERVFVVEHPDDRGRLTALSRADGGREWTLDTRGVGYRPVRTGDALYLCASGERNRSVAEDFHAAVLSLNPGSGERYWKFRLRGYSADPPVAAGESVFVTYTTEDGMALLAFGY